MAETQRSANAPTDEATKLARAKRRVAEIKGFYLHLTIFVLVVGGLFVINFLAGGEWWAPWVLFGWGIGVLAHGIAVAAHGSQRMAEWEQRKIKQLMDER